jgi:hypothetical protein
MVHPVNLPALKYLFPPEAEAEAVEKIRGSTVYPPEPVINLPDLRLHQQNWTDVIAVDRKFSLDFKKMATNVGNTAGSYAMTTDDNVQGLSGTAHSVMPSIVLVLSILAIALSAYVGFKPKALAGLLPVEMGMPVAKAQHT